MVYPTILSRRPVRYTVLGVIRYASVFALLTLPVDRIKRAMCSNLGVAGALV